MTVVAEIFQKVAARIGAKVTMEPPWGHVGQITFRSGRKRYFRFSSTDINALGSSEISKDKDFANFFMAKMKYPTVPGRTFFRTEWAKRIRSPRNIAAGYAYALRMGLPVIVKPNSGSQGTDVALVHTKTEFYLGMRDIFRRDRVALVQKYLTGKDYRVVVLDDEVISAYERIPLHVVGNGRSTILELLKQKQEKFLKEGRDTTIELKDTRILRKLKRMGLSYKSVPPRNEKVFLLDNANLSSGGDSKDVTRQMHESFRRIAIRLTKDMGLRLCGVDVMIDGDISRPAKKYWILEINSAPGLDHYAKSGAAQERIVEQLYLQVLKSLDRD